jgi:hypothetical protein
VTDDNLTPEELADRIPVPSEFRGGYWDGDRIDFETVNSAAIQYTDGDLILAAIYDRANEPSPEGRVVYNLARVDALGVFYMTDEERKQRLDPDA